MGQVPLSNRPSVQETASPTFEDPRWFEFANLPAGRYVVTGGVSGQSIRHEVGVSGESHVRIETVRGNCLQVSVHREDGWLGQAGLRNRDRIVAVSGQRIDGQEFLDSCSSSPGEVAVRVVRGDEEITLQIDLATIWKSRERRSTLGGGLRLRVCD